jgi:hypothetical protein
MKVIMLNGKIAVESINKIRKKAQNSFMVMPDNDFSTGIIKYIGEDYSGPLEPKMTVCFGDARTQLRIAGEELLVMDASNIYAILEDADEKSKENN